MAIPPQPPANELTEEFLLNTAHVIAEDMAKLGYRLPWGIESQDAKAITEDLQNKVRAAIAQRGNPEDAYWFLTQDVLQDFIHWQGVGESACNMQRDQRKFTPSLK